MKKLLSGELKRTIISPILWLSICALIVLNMYRIVLSSYGFTISAATFLSYNMPIICICLSTLIPLHIGQEFETRTINNKIIAGYSRKQIYIAEMIVSIICGFTLLFADTCSILFCTKIVQLPFGIKFDKMAVGLAICAVCITAVASLFSMIAMLIHNRLHSIAVALCLVILALQIGRNTVSALKQSKYSEVENEYPVENPLYIDGAIRTMANAHVLLSPFAQVKYHPEIQFETPEIKAANSLIFKSSSYHWEFCIMNIIELIAFSKIGISVFKRQNLK